MDLQIINGMNPAEQVAVINHAARTFGIVGSAPAAGFLPLDVHTGVAMDHAMAMDALPALVTVSNAGVPAFLTNYVDPKIIDVLTAPRKSTDIYPETKKGDWTTLTAYFNMMENVGEVSSYGDYNENGVSNANVNWPQRQSYFFQTNTNWGDREMAMMGNAQIDWAAQQKRSSANTIAQFQNKAYFYGVANLQNYGILNDPGLNAAISPNAKAAGGFTWAVATYLEVIEDVAKLFKQLVLQTGGLVDLETPMKLCMSPTVSVNLTKTTSIGSQVSVWDFLKKTYPNMELVTAVQYATGSGELVQLIAATVEGQQTGQTAFSEKMRSHGVVRKSSSYSEKQSAGTWGAIIFNPAAVGQMLGV